MKRLALALALLCVPALALAQSDQRRVAVFTLNGGSNVNRSQTCGNDNATTYLVTQTHTLVMESFRRMGVPVVVFNCADSSGWEATMRANATVAHPYVARTAGMADSTWFRSNGYMGCIFVVNRIVSSGDTTEPIRFFQSGNVRGKLAGSPLDGLWGIPTIVFHRQLRSFNAGSFGYFCGLMDANPGTTISGDTTAFVRAAFADNGDSLGLYNGQKFQRDPSQADSFTVVIYQGDTLSASGSFMQAWRWKNSTYYYPVANSIYGTEPILLGIAKLFDVAGYVPRDKLNLHLTNDHGMQLLTTYTATADSFMAYWTRKDWRHRWGSMWSSLDVHPDTTVKLQWLGYRGYFTEGLHSHAYSYSSDNLDMSAAGQDTATFRARFQMAQSAMFDTAAAPGIMWTEPRGYERTLDFGYDQIKYPALSIIAQEGYYEIRAPQGDSAGYWPPGVNPAAYRKVWSGRYPSGYARPYWPSAWPWRDPVTGATMWIHGADYAIGYSCTSWVQATSLPTGITPVEAYSHYWNGRVALAILSNSDIYMHSDRNVVNAWEGFPLLMRRMTYFLNRVDNIVTVQPIYKNKVPRRHNTAWDTSGRVAWR